MRTRKFLVVIDGSPEQAAAIRYACRRALSLQGHVCLLKTLPPAVFEHWSGVRDEIERQVRTEAETELQAASALVVDLTGTPPELLLREGETWSAIRAVVAEEADIKVLVLAAAVGGRGPGPLVAALAKGAAAWAGRRLAVTLVPGDLSDAELDDLA